MISADDKARDLDLVQKLGFGEDDIWDLGVMCLVEAMTLCAKPPRPFPAAEVLAYIERRKNYLPKPGGS